MTKSPSDPVEPPRTKRRIAAPAIGAGLFAAALLIAPLAAWLHSRAKQDQIDRQTEDRLR